MSPAVPPLSRSPTAPKLLSTVACCFVTGAIFSSGALLVFRQASSTRSRRDRRPFSNMSQIQVAGGRGLVIPAPSGNADSAVIFMHGLGDTAFGWADAFPMKGLPNTRYILPTSDVIPVSLNMGMKMPSWFDLYGLTPGVMEDTEGIEKALDRVNRIIDDEMSNGVPSNRIVVGGFSQGGALALTAGLRHARRLAGVVALSAWLPLSKTYPEKLANAAKEVPFLMCSGEVDNVVNPLFCSQSSKAMSDLGVEVEFKSYADLAHSANAAELHDVQIFIHNALRHSS